MGFARRDCLRVGLSAGSVASHLAGERDAAEGADRAVGGADAAVRVPGSVRVEPYLRFAAPPGR